MKRTITRKHYRKLVNMIFAFTLITTGLVSAGFFVFGFLSLANTLIATIDFTFAIIAGLGFVRTLFDYKGFVDFHENNEECNFKDNFIIVEDEDIK